MDVTAAPVREKDPRRVAAGKAGMAKRWGPYPARIVRLDSLDPVTREVIVSILQARRNAAASGHE